MGLAGLASLPFLGLSGDHGYQSVLTGAGAPGCYDMVSLAIGGRGDVPSSDANNQYIVAADGSVLPAAKASSHSSPWVDSVVNAPSATVGSNSYAAIYVDYPANMASYEDAVNAGVANTKTVMQSIAKECPNTKFSVVGYSEGADVARRLATEVGNQPAGDITIVDPNSVVGVVILADAGRTAGEGQFPGAKNPYGNPDNFNVAYQNGTQAAAGQGALPGTGGSFGALNGKVASFCSEGDLTCAMPASTSLLQLVVNVARQVNIDSIQKDGLTIANGPQVAAVIGQVALAAFNDIATQDNWMASKETFLDVLIKVSDPSYVPGEVATPAQIKQFTSKELLNVAYLPAKLRNEVIADIADNQNTIQVVQNDPYALTLGPDTGHHFDYWRDTNAADGKNMTSAGYAAAWLTQLAADAENGQSSTTVLPDAVDLAGSAAASATKTATPTRALPTSRVRATVAANAAASTASGTSTAGATTTGVTTTAEAESTTPAAASAEVSASAETAAELPASPEVITTEAAQAPPAEEVAAPAEGVAPTSGARAAVTTTTPVPTR